MKLLHILTIILVIVLLGSLFSANYYRNKSIDLQTTLVNSEKELAIERDKEKLEDNIDWINKLKANNKVLTDKLKELQGTRPKKSDYDKRLENVKTVQDVCDEFDSIGYSICDGVYLDCRE